MLASNFLNSNYPPPPNTPKKLSLTVLIFIFASLFSTCVDNPTGLGSFVPVITKPPFLVVLGVLTKEQPKKLEYISGERLDLTGLVVTIFFDYEEPSQDVAFEDFAKWGIWTNPEHGDRLTRTQNHGGNVLISILSAGLDLDSEDDDEEMQGATKLLTVHRGDPLVHWPEGLEISFFQTLSHAKMNYNYAGANDVTGVFAWEIPNTPLDKLGKVLCNLIFTPDDSSNYNIVMRNIEVESRFMEMVWIEPGTFQMGSPSDEANRKNNELQHTVTLTKGFYMGKYEVTQEQYKKVMGENPGYYIGRLGVPTVISWNEAIAFCNRLSVMEGLMPVYKINGESNPDNWPSSSNSDMSFWYRYWNEQNGYCDPSANGYRLPTEAEWEYACRAGTTTAYNTGLDYFTDDTGWYSENSNDTRQEVGQKPPNAWGLYDMHGNVFEFCFDRFQDYFYSEGQLDPCNDSRYVYISGNYIPFATRGGGCTFPADWLRSAWRMYITATLPKQQTEPLGFRVIRY